MLVYIGIFLVGFFYVWKKGVLDWGETSPKRGEFLMPLAPAITDLEQSEEPSRLRPACWPGIRPRL